MDKAILERRLHLTVTFIGGFMGCYAIFNRCDVFGSAQTGNLISFVMDLTGHSDPHMFLCIADLHFGNGCNRFSLTQAAEDHSEIRQSPD